MRNPQPGDRSKANSAAGTVHDPGLARRWRLQRKAQGILADKALRENRHGVTVPHFEFRVAMCHRATDGGPIAIKRSADRLHARLTGVQTCGSVWHCPICAPKVSAVRRDEMNAAIAAHVQGGGAVYFLTYTMQHDAATFGAGRLADAGAALALTLSRVKGSRAYRAILADALGTIRALEVTYGEMNGWHVHTHELLFAAAGAERELRRRLRKLWARALIKRGLAGLKPGDIGADRRRKLRNLLAHCFTVQPGDYAAEYVAKFGREPEGDRGAWGIGSEMTRAHLKQGAGAREGVPQRCDHATPWGLLNDALDGDERSEFLFREFAIAFQGRRQLVWAPGLKKHFFGIVDRSDEEIAAAPDARCTEHVCEVGPLSWARVLAHNARFDLLRAAAIGGAEGVRDFLAGLEHGPPGRFSGEYREGAPVPLRGTVRQLFGRRAA